jgi:hypothetical protein
LKRRNKNPHAGEKLPFVLKRVRYKQFLERKQERKKKKGKKPSTLTVQL